MNPPLQPLPTRRPRATPTPWRWTAAGLLGLILGLVLDPIPAPAGRTTPEMKLPAPIANAATTLVWHATLKASLARATANYQPVLALFSSPDCHWCTRLKEEMLQDPDTRNLLRHFALVEINVLENPDIAENYQLRGVPVVMILSANGDVQASATGYLTAPDLQTLLKNALNPDFLRRQNTRFEGLLKMTRENRIPPDRWPDLMLALGSREIRATLHDAILDLKPFPRTQLTALLGSPRLAVRLGALELLEEVAGETFGFDPWLTAANQDNPRAMIRWNQWATATDTNTTPVFAALSREQIDGYVQDLVSNHPTRSPRARQMLRFGGAAAADALTTFLRNQPNLPPATANIITEARYAAILDNIDNLEPSTMAHRLVYGTLDVRQKSVLDLAPAGVRAVPILRDFLDDPDPLLREAAVDALVSTGVRGVVNLFAERLTREKDEEVVCGILRRLGQIRSKKGLALLSSYLTHSNEDLVVTALGSIGRLKSHAELKAVAACLNDPRWRVRVAALETIGALKADTLADKVTALLNDQDDFVRYAAVKALPLCAAKKSAPKLEEIYLREDGIKGPVVSAFVSMQMPLPKSFGKALTGKSPDVLLSVIESIQDNEEKYLDLPLSLVRHEDTDVACAAIRIVAQNGMQQFGVRAALTEILKKGKRETKLAVLESISENTAGPNLTESITINLTAKTGSSGGFAGTVIDNLMQAFAPKAIAPADTAVSSNASTSPAPDAATTADAGLKPAAASADDLFAAFSRDSGATDSTSAAAPSSAAADGSMDALLSEAHAIFMVADDPELTFQAALLLARCGHTNSLPYLQADLTERTVQERINIANSLEGVATTSAPPILRMLLHDPVESVRSAAVSSCLENKASPTFKYSVMEELLRPETPLKPHEIYQHDYLLLREVRQGRDKRSMAEWGRRFVNESTNTPTRIFGMVLLETCGGKGDATSLTPFTKSNEPLLRRAAYHALGKLNPAGISNWMNQAAGDTSDSVRMVIPNILNQTMPSWIHFFDEEHFETGEDNFTFSHSSHTRVPELPAGAEELLLRLTRDDSPKVRIEAFFSLIANRRSVNLADFVKTIDAFPDRKAIRSRVANFLTSSYESLGKNFGVLFRYLEEEREESKYVERIRQHFGIGAEDEDAVIVECRTDAPRELAATFLTLTNTPDNASTHTLKLISFTSPGCSECARVEQLWPAIMEVFPWLEIQTYNIRTVNAMRLNEALCEKFGVMENQRLVTPIVFSSAGFLLKNDITFDQVGNLLARSAQVTSEDWLAASERELAAAETTIVSRYETFSPWLVAGSGLLDGINPCAFATIIFLISYLQITRRPTREMIRVALAFIAGVFLAYLGLGLGLAEIASRMLVLKSAGLVFNGLLAAIALILMVLNVRDGILCLRGRLKETALQLPGFLKRATHIVIRHGARHTHFVIAAFVTGIVVSVLELACTGQVYAPTIGFIVKTRSLSTGALGLLLLYNAAFILPLVVILLLTFYGLTAEHLTRVLQRHIAAVKFGTAALFLILLILFIFGYAS